MNTPSAADALIALAETDRWGDIERPNLAILLGFIVPDVEPPRLAGAFQDLKVAVSDLRDLRDGVTSWAEVEPDMQGAYREDDALAIAEERVLEAVADILLPPGELRLNGKTHPARPVIDITPTL